MRGLSSSVLSVAAMGLSSLTTYLTFFDASYALTSANASVSVQIQQGSSSHVKTGIRTAYYRFFPRPSIILSNRGKLALVVSDVSLHRSTNLERCVVPEGDKGSAPFFERGQDPAIPSVVEPETIKHLELQFSLKGVEAKAQDGQPMSVPTDQSLYCLKWTVFDPNGKRHEPLAPLVRLTRRYEMDAKRKYPQASIEKDVPREPIRLVSRGFY